MSIARSKKSLYGFACALVLAALAFNFVVAEASVSPPPPAAPHLAQMQDCVEIQGFVFEDLNADGVQNENET